MNPSKKILLVDNLEDWDNDFALYTGLYGIKVDTRNSLKKFSGTKHYDTLIVNSKLVPENRAVLEKFQQRYPDKTIIIAYADRVNKRGEGQKESSNKKWQEFKWYELRDKILASQRR